MSSGSVDLGGFGTGGGGGGVTSLNLLTGAITIIPGTGVSISTPTADSIEITSTIAGGTVTQVALSDTSGTPIYTVGGSPINTNGTFTLTLNTQTANRVFAGPTVGGAAQPTFRALVAADIPALSYVSSIGVTAPIASTGGLTPTLSIPVATAIANGYLSSADWSTFNGKQASGNYITALTGDVTASGPGSVAATIAANAVGNTKLAQMAATTLKGNSTGVLANAQDLSVTTVAGMLPVFTAVANGTAPLSGGGTTNFLRADGSWTSCVTSVGLTMPAMFSVANSPVTGSATLAVTYSGTPLPIANGGTGTGTTAAAAFNALSPTTTLGDVIYANGAASNTRLGIGTAGQVLTVVAGVPAWTTVGGTGTVTSIALSDASTTPIYTVGGSPITTNGTLTLTLQNQAQNTFFCGSNGGGAAQPTFRAIAVADVPTLNQNTTGTAANITAASNTSLTTLSNLVSIGTITTGVWNGTLTGNYSFLTAGVTYTTPAGITANTLFKFTLVGGGGGGGGSNAANAKGSGGGAGGTCILFITGLTASTGYTIAIGSAGAGGINTTTPATAGGDTTLLIGVTTYTASGGGAGTSAVQSEGGAGGASTNGTINVAGQAGSACATAAGSNVGGIGGSSLLGLGGAGKNNAGAGNAGSGYGAGGGGSVGAAANGGAGTQGCILVEWQN